MERVEGQSATVSVGKAKMWHFSAMSGGPFVVSSPCQQVVSGGSVGEFSSLVTHLCDIGSPATPHSGVSHACPLLSSGICH